MKQTVQNKKPSSSFAPSKKNGLFFKAFVQPKLTIGPSNDIYEQEADAMAERVMQTANNEKAQPSFFRPAISSLQRKCQHCEEEEKNSAHSIQRKCDHCEEEEKNMPHMVQRKCDHCEEDEKHLQRKTYSDGSTTEATREVDDVLDSPGGQSLDAGTRNFMEQRFNYDFSGVKIHNDQKAIRSAAAINALAYTSGNNIVFNAGLYNPGSDSGKKLLAHELTHVVQQGSASPVVHQTASGASSAIPNDSDKKLSPSAANVIQRAGDPTALPPGFPCPTDLTTGTPAGTNIVFPVGGFVITPAHSLQLSTLMITWLAAGGRDTILVHGYASTEGAQGSNWTLSCARAQAVQSELIRLGIPPVRINIVAHGESTDFGAGVAPNQHAVASIIPSGVLPPLPLAGGLLTARDNFAGRNLTSFGVGEIIDLSFFSLPPRPAADFGGLEWRLAGGGGALTNVTNAGTATYTAPALASTVQLELRVASGATIGRVISTHTISIVIPESVRITEVPGSSPNFRVGGTIPAGTWGAGFLGSVFVNPKDVSFQGVIFGEGTVTVVVSGSFMAPFAGTVHPVNTFGPGHAGNATTGTPVSPPNDQITGSGLPTSTVLGVTVCGAGDFLWAIPWEFQVGAGARTRFARGFTANHHMTSTLFCDATIEKGGAGPFRRPI